MCEHRDIEGAGCPSDDDLEVATIEFLSDRFKEADPWDYMRISRDREDDEYPWLLTGHKDRSWGDQCATLGRFSSPRDAHRYGRLLSGHARTPIKLTELPYRAFYAGNQLMRGGRVEYEVT
jgi:hypothetical protein